ncbi:unnamed protein product [Caenorhabditis auriculariae]|uniref:SAP domain-containing protein n=1 Tax=Caenorhabditis auriculariae TaxID=2777116 RepID=A0A8S1GSE9_9PELO|nr:unnamed protein product [Caenorhabditis auriculariae]
MNSLKCIPSDSINNFIYPISETNGQKLLKACQKMIQEADNEQLLSTSMMEQHQSSDQNPQPSVFFTYANNGDNTTMFFENTSMPIVLEEHSAPTPIEPQMEVPQRRYQPYRRRMIDFKVQELKAECKKRMLPVSGPKTQLLERLRPYENEIMNDEERNNRKNSASDVSQEVRNIEEIISNSPPSLFNMHQEPQREIFNTNESGVALPTVQGYTTLASNVFEKWDGIQQAQPEQPAQSINLTAQQYLPQSSPPEAHNQSSNLILQIPAPQNGQPAPQMVQVLDANGTVLGMASVQYPVMTTFQENQSSIIHPSVFLNQQENTSVFNEVNTHQGRVQPGQIIQKNDKTYQFSQMGSGGQFTMAPSEHTRHEIISSVHSAVQTLHCGPPKTTATVSSTGPLLLHKPMQQGSVQINQAVVQQPVQCQLLVQEKTNESQSKNVHHVMLSQMGSIAQQSANPISPLAADHAGNSPNMPGSTNLCVVNAPSGEMTEIVAESGDGSVQNPITLETADPSKLLTPMSLQVHEEMLREQQRDIEELIRKLTQNQTTLKKQQQLILTAKKTQQRLREQKREHVPAAPTNAEIGVVNKQHIQQFLQHRLHQQQCQTLISEHNRLAKNEIRLQEELHVEQAVNDIVRLIKQDARTALLIVQLLRRYQLERDQKIEQAAPNSNTANATDFKTPAIMEYQQSKKRNSIGQPVPVQLKNNYALSESTNYVAPIQTISIIQELPQSPLSLKSSTKKEVKDVTMEEIFRTVIEEATRASDAPTTEKVDDLSAEQNIFVQSAEHSIEVQNNEPYSNIDDVVAFVHGELGIQNNGNGNEFSEENMEHDGLYESESGLTGISVNLADIIDWYSEDWVDKAFEEIGEKEENNAITNASQPESRNSIHGSSVQDSKPETENKKWVSPDLRNSSIKNHRNF